MAKPARQHKKTAKSPINKIKSGKVVKTKRAKRTSVTSEAIQVQIQHVHVGLQIGAIFKLKIIESMVVLNFLFFIIFSYSFICKIFEIA